MSDILFELENFQSIDNFAFRLQPGFYCVTGRSNLGKSALVRGMRALLYNELHPSFIRRGAEACKLRLTFPVELSPTIKSVELYKSKSKNIYTVVQHNGEAKAYPKIGAVDTPQELKDLGFNLLQTEREEFYNLNFQGQLEPLFLVTDTPTSFTSFVNKVFGIAKYERALRDINADLIKFTREYDALTPIILQKRNELQDLELGQAHATSVAETFKGQLDTFTEHAQTGQRLGTAHQQWGELTQQATQHRRTYSQAQQERGHLGTISERLARLAHQRQLRHQWETQHRDLTAMRGNLVGLTGTVNQLTASSTPLTFLQRAVAARQQLLQLQQAGQQHRAVLTQARQEEVALQAQAERIASLQQARATLEELQKRGQQAATLQQRWTAASQSLALANASLEHHRKLVVAAEKVRDTAVPLYRNLQARAARQQLQTSMAEQQNARQQAEQQRDQLAEARTRIEEAIGVCPTCNRPFTEHAAH